MNLLHKWSAQGSSQYIGEYMFGQVLCTSAQHDAEHMRNGILPKENLSLVMLPWRSLTGVPSCACAWVVCIIVQFGDGKQTISWVDCAVFLLEK